MILKDSISKYDKLDLLHRKTSKLFNSPDISLSTEGDKLNDKMLQYEAG